MNVFRKFLDGIQSVYFNFHYLPIRQAVKLPIILHHASLKDVKGGVKIQCDNIYRGMIHLGCYGVCLYPDNGIVWENHGGTVIFQGKVSIGSASALSINKHAEVIFGEDFINTAALKLVASRKISFGKSVRLGWNTMIMDTNMHPLKNKLTGKRSSGGSPIEIGDYCWISTNSMVLPGVHMPERVICALGSLVTRSMEYESWCMYGGSPIRKLKDNIYRDFDDDRDETVYDIK